MLIRSSLWFLIPVLILSVLPSAYGQLSVGTVQGDVRIPAPPDDLKTRLTEVSSASLFAETPVGGAGQFVFRSVPFGTYLLSLSSGGAIIARQTVVVNSPVTVVVHFDSSDVISMQEVTVQALKPDEATVSHTFYAEEKIEALPSFTGPKLIESVLLNTPGVVPDEDGRMHVRGEDAQLQYVVDGIPITANMTRVYSSLFDAGTVRSMDIQTGGLNAQYGVATAGILAVNTKSGFNTPLSAVATGRLGSFDSRDASLQLSGGLGEGAALYLAGRTSTSERYLDPITSGDPIHDRGTTDGFFGKVDLLPSETVSINILGGYNQTTFEIPNGIVKEPPQDQQQEVSDYLLGARVNLSTGETSLLSGLVYHRHGDAMVTSGGLMRLTPADYPKAIAENEDFFFGGDRSSSNTGAQAEFSTHQGWFDLDHALKTGVGYEVYPVKEFFTFAVTNPDLSESDSSGGDDRYLPYDITKGGAPFLVDQSKPGHRYSAFVQDELRFGKWIVNAGLRFDSFSLLETENSVSPRVNIALAAYEDLFLRASYNRIVMQAPLENYLVSSSDEARMLVGAEQGSIPTVVMSEKAHVAEIGGTFLASRFVTLDLSIYGKLINDFLVKVELGTSGVIFPANLKEGFVAGTELQVRLSEWNNLSALLSVSTTVSRGLIPEDGSSPVSAGLILGEEGENYAHPFTGEDSFPTEHNQIVTVVGSIAYHHPSGLFGVVGGRLDSGLPFDLTGPNGEPLNEQESEEELRRRGYSDDVIDLLDLKPEKEGSPDRQVAPHAVFDVTLGYDFEPSLSVPVRLSGTMLNVFDTPYLYKFESTFGGTHFGVPRFFSLQLDVRVM